MKERDIHKLAGSLETRNKLKSLLNFAAIPSAVTITFAAGSFTRSVTIKELSDREALVNSISDLVGEIEDRAVDLGVVFD